MTLPLRYSSYLDYDGLHSKKLASLAGVSVRTLHYYDELRLLKPRYKPENRFSLSIDQSLILAMEDEARWMISNKLTGEKQVPNFLDYIWDDGLKAIKPEAVNIIC